jgi:hypothetical protein
MLEVLDDELVVVVVADEGRPTCSHVSLESAYAAVDQWGGSHTQ